MKQPTDDDRGPSRETANATPIVFEAIVKHQAIAATYNHGDVTLAPHILYTRHGELYLDAVTIERDGRPPREAKIGSFKLDGLAPVRLTPRRFTPSALFAAGEPRYDGVTLLAIEGD